MMRRFAIALAMARPRNNDLSQEPMADGLWYMMISADLVGYAQDLGYVPRDHAETQQNRRVFIKRVFDLDLPPDADRLIWPPA
jgi:hypothetical protein